MCAISCFRLLPICFRKPRDKHMAAQRKALTKLVIEKAPPVDKRDVFLWDSRVPGFGVSLYPSG